jgi:recombination protein RecA
VESNLIEKSGTWYSYNGERLGQGRENAKNFLRDHPELISDIDAKIRLACNLKPVAGAALTAAD